MTEHQLASLDFHISAKIKNEKQGEIPHQRLIDISITQLVD